MPSDVGSKLRTRLRKQVHSHQAKENAYSPLLPTGKTTPGTWCPVLTLQSKQDVDKPERVQQGNTEIGERLEQ